MLKKSIVCTLSGLLLVAGTAQAANVLIINGINNTSESDTTNDITSNWTPVCGTGHSVTVLDTPPASLAGYQQIWDLRFSDSSPLTASDQTAYLSFLQNGGGLFLMGENASFMTRNNSVIDFIDLAGGGSLTFTAPSNPQDVHGIPFTNGGLTSINWNAAGGTTTAGTGSYAASNAGSGGSALTWSPGELSNAPAGKLAVVFDVNFMQSAASTDQAQFFKNLCGFVSNVGPVTPSTPLQVPVDAPWALLGLGTLIAGLTARRQAKAKFTD